MKFTLLESKADVIKRWVDTGKMEAYNAKDESVSPEDVINKFKLQDYIKPRN
jgi:hypothetical protein